MPFFFSFNSEPAGANAPLLKAKGWSCGHFSPAGSSWGSRGVTRSSRAGSLSWREGTIQPKSGVAPLLAPGRTETPANSPGKETMPPESLSNLSQPAGGNRSGFIPGMSERDFPTRPGTGPPGVGDPLCDPVPSTCSSSQWACWATLCW